MSSCILFINREPISISNIIYDSDSKEQETIEKLSKIVSEKLKEIGVNIFDWFGQKLSSYEIAEYPSFYLYRDQVTYEPYIEYFNFYTTKDEKGKEITIEIIDIDRIKNDKDCNYDYKEVMSKLNNWAKSL